MDEAIDRNRRRFFTRSVLTVAAAQLGAFDWLNVEDTLHVSGAVAAAHAGAQRTPRQLSALVRASEWLSSPPLTAEALAGKAVVVDFGTYTCINWLRTLPYVRAWADKYGQALTVIGVHTPEFPFEHNVGNVRRAIQQLGLEFPIAIDNDFAIWRAFDNQYWPALYLVDARGRIRHHQLGEGGYTATEQAIQRVLSDGDSRGADKPGTRGFRLQAEDPDQTVSVRGTGFEAAADWANLKSPETYVGYERTANFTSRDGVRRNQPRTYRPASRLASNQWSLAGDWTIGGQKIALNAAPGRILYRFHARDVHLVMGPSNGDGAVLPAEAGSHGLIEAGSHGLAEAGGHEVHVRVTIDGQPPGAAHGLDIDEAGAGVVREQRLYQLVRQPSAIVDRTVAIEFLDSNVELFAFTFG